MPCNSIAVIAIAIELAQLNELRNDADAMNTLKLMLEEQLGVSANVTVRGSAQDRSIMIFLPNSNRYVQISEQGLELYGYFDREQRTTIEEFIKGLLLAMTENRLVQAIASQLPMLSDEPVVDEWQNVIGRQLVVRV